MINFIIVSHGEMANGVFNAVRLISGQHAGVEIISLKENDSIDGLQTRIETAIKKLEQSCDGILVFVDLFGASPFNAAARASAKLEHVEVISGLNLPMLLETILQRETLTLSEAKKLALESGQYGIKILSDLIST